jgi:Mg2+-importing ATPase
MLAVCSFAEYEGKVEPLTAAAAIKALKELGVGVKILTGDNDKVTRAACRHVGLPFRYIMLGSDLDNINDKKLGKIVEETDVFAKLSPQRKRG